MATGNNYKVLIVDDEIEYQRVLSIILEDQGYTTYSCSNGKEALDFLNDNDIDLVITDLRMPVMTGEEMIAKVREKNIDCDIIVATAFGSIESAVDAIRMGASEYFVKSQNMDELIIKIERLSKLRRLENRSRILIQNQNNVGACLETKSEEFKRVIDICNRTADTDISILILGESGVGKEVIANYIHGISNRAHEPFIPVNCQVFPEGVIESELFGHEKGAFTGAVETRKGKFEEANFGTLFLDEIGDLPMMTQGKLLRSLETKSIERVGSNKRIDLDVRFIFATNKDLIKGIEDGKFREDLLYRINTLSLTIPPLRERKEDLPSLIEFFVKKTAIEQKKKDITIEDEVMEKLLSYNYPGNVRELRNIIERMIALSRNGRVTMQEFSMPSSRDNLFDVSGEIIELRDARGKFEKQYISIALKKNGWNVEKTALSLGITSRQLWNKISQYDIRKEKGDNA